MGGNFIVVEDANISAMATMLWEICRSLRWQINRALFTKDDILDIVVEIVFRSL